MERVIRIAAVIPLDGQRVQLLRLTNGDTVERDLRALLRAPHLAPLRDAGRFAQVSVDHGTLVWPGELDIAPETLIWDGPDPADPAVRPPAMLEPREPQAAYDGRQAR